MNKRKIINDPIYGFITIEHELLFDLIEHPTFQRLRRIRQLGLTHLIYPGANHTRFHHALGAMHLVTMALRVLMSKGVVISKKEVLGTQAAILLHDIGHGPFSHALEGKLINCSHEELTLELMKRLNQEFDHQLDLAIQIFSGTYHKVFLHQLVSGQLDMDRMDYLTRDSFYSGVIEGKVGYDRIIAMLNVVDNELAVEEKGIHSIEAFLIARKIMYWQVYLHQAVLAAELMLVKAIERVGVLMASSSGLLDVPAPLRTLLETDWQEVEAREKMISSFLLLDDYDIIVFFKKSLHCGDFLLDNLTHGLTHRKLFRVDFSNFSLKSDKMKQIRQKVGEYVQNHGQNVEDWIWKGKETVGIYDNGTKEIKMLLKNGKSVPLSAYTSELELDTTMTRYYVCYPKY